MSIEQRGVLLLIADILKIAIPQFLDMADVSDVLSALGAIDQKRTALFVCDMQEKFRSTITYFPQIVETSNKLLQTCKVLEVPYLVTEQYPKGS